MGIVMGVLERVLTVDTVVGCVGEGISCGYGKGGVLERVLTVGTVVGCVGEGISCGYCDGVCWRGY